MIVIDGQKVT